MSMRVKQVAALVVLSLGCVVVTAQDTGDPNSFNRLMKEQEPCNQPPTEDGIHDPDNPATGRLQKPSTAFAPLPDSSNGNCVDWSAAVENDVINPRWSLKDPSAKPMELNLNIVREVKGSMPDVVYPHKQHTAWLDCSNCHPRIFIPKKGANQISMASIILGRKCGVCHGKVAFPVSDCLRCHSGGKKASSEQASASGNSSGATSQGKIKNAGE